jgi:plasmid maintenance system antidote protein VapI
MYEQYLSISTIPAGAILNRILQKENISQQEISVKSSVLPQLINDLITGKKRFTPEISIRLEQALGISEVGYFYKIQANHEIYLYTMELVKKDAPNLAKLKKALFWDTDINQINWRKNAKWVVQRVFEYGNDTEIQEIIRFYGKIKVKEILDSINEKWKEESRNKNKTTYLQ